MALINCPECGKEISDTCESCIHCGYKLTNSEGSKGKQANKKKVPIIAIFLIIVIIIGIGIASILIINSTRENNRIEQEKQEQISIQADKEAKKLTYEEEICYYAIQHFKTILRNPDSLQIHKIEISPDWEIVSEGLDSNGHYSQYIVWVDYSAQNGFGGDNREEYYIHMTNKSVSKNTSYDQQILEMHFTYPNTVDVDKIKYALDHPEVLDY